MAEQDFSSLFEYDPWRMYGIGAILALRMVAADAATATSAPPPPLPPFAECVVEMLPLKLRHLPPKDRTINGRQSIFDSDKIHAFRTTFGAAVRSLEAIPADKYKQVLPWTPNLVSLTCEGIKDPEEERSLLQSMMDNVKTDSLILFCVEEDAAYTHFSLPPSSLPLQSSPSSSSRTSLSQLWVSMFERCFSPAFRSFTLSSRVLTEMDDENDPQQQLRLFLSRLHRKCPHLRALNLYGPHKVHKSLVEAIFTHLPNVAEFDASGLVVDDGSLEVLAERASGSLERITFKEETRLPIDGLVKLVQGCRHLRHLDVSFSIVDQVPKFLDAITEHAAALTSLHYGYTDRSLPPLGDHEREVLHSAFWRMVHRRGRQFTALCSYQSRLAMDNGDQLLKLLRCCPRLQEVYYPVNVPLDDDFLRQISMLPMSQSLTRVYLEFELPREGTLTVEGIKAFVAKMPKLEFSLIILGAWVKEWLTTESTSHQSLLLSPQDMHELADPSTPWQRQGELISEAMRALTKQLRDVAPMGKHFTLY